MTGKPSEPTATPIWDGPVPPTVVVSTAVMVLDEQAALLQCTARIAGVVASYSAMNGRPSEPMTALLNWPTVLVVSTAVAVTELEPNVGGFFGRMSPLTVTVPTTSSAVAGVSVPKPTLPALALVISE